MPVSTKLTAKYIIKSIPGYLLKGLMSGSLLEKLLSRSGTLNINQLNAYLGKAPKLEKDVIGKVLQENFAGLQAIDFNDLKLAVHNNLITYTRKPQVKFSTYGMDRLGFNIKRKPDGTGGIIEFVPGVATNTFTFESPRIPNGNKRHYASTTLGHVRTFINPTEPGILHILENLSDWGQAKFFGRNHLTDDESNAHFKNTLLRLFAKKYPEDVSLYVKLYNSGGPNQAGRGKYSPDFAKAFYNNRERLIGSPDPDVVLRLTSYKDRLNATQIKYLHDNYSKRQLQEALKYASENGLSVIRYPTPETAAKIENYSKTEPTPEYLYLLEELDRLKATGEGDLTPIPDEINLFNDEATYYTPEKREELIREVENKLADISTALRDYTYPPQHLGILKKYQQFPKLFETTVPGSKGKVRIVTDSKGNSWYEADVPADYLNSEWAFKCGGKIKQRFKSDNRV